LENPGDMLNAIKYLLTMYSCSNITRHFAIAVYQLNTSFERRFGVEVNTTSKEDCKSLEPSKDNNNMQAHPPKSRYTCK
jgi:hypothetical protein